MWLTRLSGVLVLAVLSTLPLLGGCAVRGTTVQVPINGVALPAEYGTKVEVSNWNGSVYVVADPRYKTPSVSARLRPTGRGGPKVGELPQTVMVRANSSISGSERLLRVSSVPAGEPPA